MCRFLSGFFRQARRIFAVIFQMVGCNPMGLHFRVAKNPSFRISREFNTAWRKIRQKDVCVEVFKQALNETI